MMEKFDAAETGILKCLLFERSGSYRLCVSASVCKCVCGCVSVCVCVWHTFPHLEMPKPTQMFQWPCSLRTRHTNNDYNQRVKLIQLQLNQFFLSNLIRSTLKSIQIFSEYSEHFSKYFLSEYQKIQRIIIDLKLIQ